MRARPRILSHAALAALLLAVAAPARATVSEPAAAAAGLALASPLAVEAGEELLAQRGMGRDPKRPRKPRPDRPPRAEREGTALGGERARLMLRSLTLPGWGQASLGQHREAVTFALLEAGVWASFTAFRVQERMRRQSYERTARLFAGIDLAGRDDEFRRIVGFYLSSEEYNRLVVRRDAANLFFGDPAAFEAYIAEHELRGADAWAWDDVESLLRYRTERQETQRATRRAHTALAAAIINRLLAVVHAARGPAPRDPAAGSWRLEWVPDAEDPTAFSVGVRADF